MTILLLVVTCNLLQRASFDQSSSESPPGYDTGCDLLLLRAMLSYWLQPFDEAPLADMPFADRLQPVGELANRPPLLGDRLEVEQKTGGRIVAGSIAALDFGPPRATRFRRDA
ncbi:MAG: hypothetical protein E5Y16_24055 [Mesorhizobium sp.]|uniref:hypothetical protein n=1 Tax=Mesorhizobium sp. TaxID=1871066 RepID=UPI000FEA61B0|nr:hypothetical protein [Mesorhizobium sp.]RWB03432.1 MAG: hypothetical protein EOQ33_13365 [Mesorhizobium sp.]RWO31379.1 MAG: hypothetical protein EOS08_10220 [Mesorhizobium sp.]TJV28598.1 MAG: hypothetical protein E5Y16_24055 [Mesorhizobium sp.]